MPRLGLLSARTVRLALVVIGALALVVTLNLTVGAAASAQSSEESAQDESLVERGQELYGARCALCHGESGRGGDGGPSLIGVGAASVDFYIRTGRMPLSSPDERPVHQEPKLNEEQKAALIAYVTSLPGEGPDIPNIEGWSRAELTRGFEIFTENCAACHGPTAAGIAVGQRDISSNLEVSTPLEIAEAIRIGPGVMPLFGEDAISQEELEAVVAWVMHLRQREEPGGTSIGRSGPVTEGLVAWVVGLGGLAVVMYLLGEKQTGDDDAEAA